MTARYYFSDENLDSLIALLEKRPAGVHRILIGSNEDIAIVGRLIGLVTARNRTLAEWVVAKISAKELDIRVMKKAELPQGVDLTTHKG